MNKYMEDLYDIVDLIEGLANDILDIIASCENESDACREISYYIAIFSIKLLKNYSM